MKKIILESDDFGITPQTSAVILDLLQKKLITSTNFMVTMPESKEDAHLARSQGIKAMGLHVVLDRHQAAADVEQIPSLVDPKTAALWDFAEFSQRVKQKQIKLDEVKREIYAQLELAEKFGIRISHLTTHHGAAFIDLDFLKLFEKIAAETRLIFRNEMQPSLASPEIKAEFKQAQGSLVYPDLNYALDEGQNQPAELLNFISTCKDGQSMVIIGHGGKNDLLLEQRSSLNARREEDRATFANEELHRFLHDPKNELELRGY
ncbi:hypothetical protein LFYK43_01810 [Ligilactobacillus salitolerans]|uniref:ChbG/HpnK family deacetylase n=1 Tax=Ligilactobacillus salitolerans TaxID=1808352 RepID=A0A401IQB4_9LACO|nr:ChbG/HpnK family deacetylase [Ligilactobacillus salitolerans]GBG93722.1 hypothetical protein LFYK43_01810 [Ligilactobacillus salitolerans]